MTKGESETRQGVCVYCGKQTQVTTEHVVPRAFFPKQKPSNLITAGACFDCNNSKSKDDAYARDILLIDFASAASANAQQLRDGEFIRSVETNRSEIARVVMSDAKPSAIVTPLGDYVGPAFCVPVEQERLDRYFSLMVRGLWYHVRREMIPHDCAFTVCLMERFFIQQAWEEMAELGAEICIITPEVFATLYIIDQEYPFLSRWLLLFYGTAIVEVYTIPKGLDYTPRQSVRGLGVGDSVAFTDAALADFKHSGEKWAKAKGVIEKFIPLHKTMILAQIRWDNPDIPASVKVEELRRADGPPDPRR